MPMTPRSEELPRRGENVAVLGSSEFLDSRYVSREFRCVFLHIGLQLVFRVARTANERIAFMTERIDDASHELIVHGMLGPVFVICLMMPALRGGMRQDELDLVLGAEVE